MKNKDLKKQYPWIFKLKIPVHQEGGINYCLSAEIKEILGMEKSKLFSEYFGVATCLSTKDGQIGLYAWDVSDCLIRIFENKLVGGQRHWD